MRQSKPLDWLFFTPLLAPPLPPSPSAPPASHVNSATKIDGDEIEMYVGQQSMIEERDKEKFDEVFVEDEAVITGALSAQIISEID